MLKNIHYSLSIALITLGILINPTLPSAQEREAFLPAFSELDYLASTDPEAAIDRISNDLASILSGADPDPRIVFDLNRLMADLLISQGELSEAADLVLQLAKFAAARRQVFDRDPVVHYAEAARLYESVGNYNRVIEMYEAIVEEQRDGGLPGEVLAATFSTLARVSGLAGDAVGEMRFRSAATTASGGGGISAYSAGSVPSSDYLLTDQSASRGKSDQGFREVEVYYATDRARTGDPDPAEFYGYGRGQLELGVATVTIPDSHQPGAIETPSIWRLEFGPSAARHVVLRSVEPVEPDAFYSRMQKEFDGRQVKEAFVFIHGYNVSFEQGAKRAAQIAYDMNYFGVPVLYSWPSRGSTIGYAADTAVVRLSGRRLSRFLEDLVEKSGAVTVHVVAHSMGNRALTDALELMALRRGQTKDSKPVFGQILFAAPDVDAGLFQEMLPTIRPLAERLTLYASENDWALETSRRLHGDAPRAGQGGADTLANASIDSVDMSELGDDMLAHSYFADDSSALADMTTLFWQNLSPQRRCGMNRVDPATGAVAIWHYNRGSCAQQSLVELIASMRRANVTTAEQARAVLARTVRDADLARRLESIVIPMLTE